MPREHRYRYGPFEVVLLEAPDDEVRRWDEHRCECQGYHERSRTPRVQRPDDEECKHIRTAKLFHELRKDVSVVESGEEKGQQSLESFAN